jgi:hypothetical protein
MGNNQFVQRFMVLFILFPLVHLVIWEAFTKQIMTSDYGDLARIGYQSSSFQPRKTEVLLPRKHIKAPAWRGETVDVVTFGDSFSVGGGGGLNSYYQDYIASEDNLTVLNIERDTKMNDQEYMNALISMINGGFIDQLKPKILLLESVERLSMVRFSSEMDWESNTSSSVIRKSMQNVHHEGYSNTSIINSGNYKYFLYNLYYHFSSNAFGNSEVYKYPLNRKLFDSKAPDTLLFYNQDITSLNLVKPDNVQILNNNMNHLAELLAKKGVKLIFMPTVDKYDLYEQYIISNPHLENHFFDFLRPLPKKYYFVDTKKILEPLLEHNVSDVYHGDDTHWSYKASESVIRSIPFQKILSENSH